MPIAYICRYAVKRINAGSTSFIQKDGKITGFTIYTKAMDNQANMNSAEKAKFSITL